VRVTKFLAISHEFVTRRQSIDFSRPVDNLLFFFFIHLAGTATGYAVPAKAVGNQCIVSSAQKKIR
jgi:hypothetical protein